MGRWERGHGNVEIDTTVVCHTVSILISALAVSASRSSRYDEFCLCSFFGWVGWGTTVVGRDVSILIFL